MLVLRLLLFAVLCNLAKCQECVDTPQCVPVMSSKSTKYSTFVKCHLTVILVAPEVSKKNGYADSFTLVSEICPKTCAACAKTTTTTPLETTTETISVFDRILNSDANFRRLMEDLGSLGISINNSADGIERYKKYISQFKEAKKHNEKYERGEESYRIVVNKLSLADESERAPLILPAAPPVEIDLDSQGGTESITTPSDVDIEKILDLAERSHSHRNKRDTRPVVDWSEHMGPVSDQSTCGGCWAFAMKAMLEATISMVDNTTVTSLSVQQLLDCDRSIDLKWGVRNTGCSGGYFPVAASYLQKTSLTSHDEYPFRIASSAVCALRNTGISRRISRFDSGFVTAKSASTLETLAAAMEERVRNGPVAVGMAVSDPLYKYGGGIYDGVCGDVINHAVVIVGFTEDFWIVRNSWGSNWGENGYIRVARNDSSDPCMMVTYWATIEQLGDVEQTTQPTRTTHRGHFPNEFEEIPGNPGENNDCCDNGCCDECSECDDDEDDYSDEYGDLENENEVERSDEVSASGGVEESIEDFSDDKHHSHGGHQKRGKKKTTKKSRTTVATTTKKSKGRDQTLGERVQERIGNIFKGFPG